MACEMAFVSGALMVCGVWFFYYFAKQVIIKDAITEIKKEKNRRD